MKPTRNRYYCRACGRKKILFSTEKKAQDFLRFNTEDMDQTRRNKPVRSYYCNVCFGWHVTHYDDPEFFSNYKSPAEVAIDTHMRLQQNRAILRDKTGMQRWEIKLNEKIANSSFPDDVLACLAAAKEYKQRKDFLERSFALMCDGMRRQLESGEVTDLFMQRVKKLKTKLRLALSTLGGNELLYEKVESLYNDLQVAFLDHGIVLTPPTTEKETAEKHLNREMKRIKNLEQKMRRVSSLISCIQFSIESGSQLLAKNEIADATKKLYKLANFEYVREPLIEQVDRLIAAKAMYEEKFGQSL